MKSILTLILPGNATTKANRRYMRNGRKGIGFSYGQPVVLNDDGTETSLLGTVEEDVTSDDSKTVVLGKRLTYLTNTSANVNAVLPPVGGSLRHLVVIKNGAHDVKVTKHEDDPEKIILSGHAPSDTSKIESGSSATFISNGTNWFRVG